MENLNEKQMEELLPDYLFGKLDEKTADNFKNNLPKFPSIEKEYLSAKEVFSKIEELDMNSAFDKKAMNLSVRVHNRLNKKSAKTNKYSFFGFAVPIAAVIAVIVVFFNTSRNTDNTPKPEISKNNPSQLLSQPLITENEIEQIIEEEKSDEIINKNKDNEASNSAELIGENLDALPIEIYDYDLSESMLIEGLEELDESDFQVILQDLQSNY